MNGFLVFSSVLETKNITLVINLLCIYQFISRMRLNATNYIKLRAIL